MSLQSRILVFGTTDLVPLQDSGGLGVAAQSGNYGRQYQRCGDERHIHCKERNSRRQIAGREQARICTLHERDARVVAEGLGNLAVAGVDGQYAVRAVLQQAIGEATGGRADVQAKSAAYLDGPVGQGRFQLEAAAAHVAHLAAQQADRRVEGDGMAGLFEFLLADEDAPGQDQGLGPLPGRRQAALHQQFVETHFHLASRCIQSIWALPQIIPHDRRHS